ncbi:MAG TPA: dihydrofolate reductase family protein [Solirubrobacteraceae bacterium]|nr:dihydrofolate reductase family protein [Solirubrobacteraceae bacterium]
MRRLLPDPDPGPLEVATLIAELELAQRAPAWRPYTVANFVESVDGRATFDGRSTALGDAGDKQIFRALRSICDVVLAGTGTLAIEHYGRLVRDGALQAAREARGLPVQPLLCTVTRSGRVSSQIPLLADPDARVIVYSGAPLSLGDVSASVQVVPVDAETVTFASVLADLRARHGARLLLCEGGPTLLAQLIGERALDELFVTLAGKLAGGDGPTIVSGLTVPEPLALSLRWLLEQDGSLFARYRLPATDAHAGADA